MNSNPNKTYTAELTGESGSLSRVDINCEEVEIDHRCFGALEYNEEATELHVEYSDETNKIIQPLAWNTHTK